MKLLTQNLHTRPESTVPQAQTAITSKQGVPVNLTCKLTRKSANVRSESVSAGFSKQLSQSISASFADAEKDKSARITNCEYAAI